MKMREELIREATELCTQIASHLAKGDLPKLLILLSFKRIMNPTLGGLLLSYQPTAITH